MSEISRRQFLKYSGAAGAFLAAQHALGGLLESAYAVSPALTPFLDPMPVPPVHTPTGSVNGVPLYTVTMSQITQKLHTQLPASTLWAYNGTYPGGTFVVSTGQPIYVDWVNNLPLTHLLTTAIDRTIAGIAADPEVRVVPHVHGGNQPSAFDGGPLDWWVPGQTRRYYYPNVQPSSLIWYHDHAMGITRLNVYAGLAGGYLIKDDVDASLNLPAGTYEIPLIIQDKMFLADGSGSIDYMGGGTPPNPSVHPTWFPEFFGDVVLVNGVVWPFLNVEPRKYRFHLLNGSQARFYNLMLTGAQPFHVIGTDGGFLNAPTAVTQLLIAPGERIDVVLDFTGMAGATITMTNNAVAPFPAGLPGSEIPNVMQFRVVTPLSGPDTSVLPTSLAPVYAIPTGSANTTRDMVLQEVLGPGGPLELRINNKKLSTNPITDFPRLGTTEIWRWINTTADAHPMHIHLVQAQILDRQPFDVPTFQANGTIVFTGPAVPPAAYEAGWKDTFIVPPGQITRVITRFGSYTGNYVFHCHILEHEENEMMLAYTSTPTKYYFAEGTCRPGFEPYFTIQNPDTVTDANITITYILGDGTTRTQPLTILKNSRQTVYVKAFLGEGADAAHDFSATIESTNGVQVIAERVMYFDYGGWTDGHATIGALSTGTAWYFAEGTTRPNYDPYITIMNPDVATAANVRITYMLGNGTTQVQTLNVPVTTRATVRVVDVLGSANDAAHDFSTVVESLNGVGIVAERVMYFNHLGIDGGHGVVGALGPALDWYFAEGTCRPGFDPFITIMNPNTAAAANITITYMLGDGTTRTQNWVANPTTRITVRVKDLLGEADDAAHDFSAKVSSTNGVTIVAERPMYFNFRGRTGGSCVMGSVLPNYAYYLAEGTCRPSFEPYITVMNPNATTNANVKITYYLGDGTSQVQNLVVAKSSRATVPVKSFLGEGEDVAHDFSAKVECTNGPQIIVERPMYFTYAGWTGGDSAVGLAY